jgi:phosphohistidine swiveling domain-containing protein
MAVYYGWPAWEFKEERDLSTHKVWVSDRKETLRTITFLDYWMLFQYANGFAPGADYFQIPSTRGADWRDKEGWILVSVKATTEEEQKQREPEFRKRIAPWIDDFGKEYHKYVDELNGMIAKIKAVDMEKATDWDLKRAFEDWVEFYVYAAEVHFIWMYAWTIIFTQFEDVCKELLNIDKYDRLFNDIMGGADHKLLQTDRGLWRLARQATELGLEPLFRSTKDNKKLLSKISQEGEKGKKWLADLRKFTSEYGWRTVDNWDISTPSWVEDPSMTFRAIRAFMDQPTFAVDKHRQRLLKAREKAEKEVISRVPEDAKEWFVKLMKAAQWSSVVGEEHIFYCENYGNALGRMVTKEIGKRFTEAGLIDEPLDVCFLTPEEITIRVILRFDAHDAVKARKKQHEEFRKAEPPPFFGNPEAIPETFGRDPALSLAVVPIPRVRPELKADLYGTSAAPGVAEGVAHVLTSEKQFGEFKAGEILVTLETSAAWTPLFGLAKAVITDVGGAASHAALLGREYGLPVVSGTVEGTKKIKTGMRVKADGDQGVVYILSK